MPSTVDDEADDEVDDEAEERPPTSRPILTYPHLSSRMLTYADVWLCMGWYVWWYV